MTKKYKDTTINVGFSNDKVPSFVEVRGKDWVKYGETNDYPQYLVLLFNRSAKHNAIVTSKQLYIKGQGFTFDQTLTDGANAASLQAFIDSPNPYESLDDLMDKTVLDFELFGGFYLRGVAKKGGKGYELYHVDYCNVRSNDDNTLFYISDEWINEEGAENSTPKILETLPCYDPSKKQKTFIYYHKSYRPNLSTYTLPEYIGAVPAIITDAEIANFHRAEIQNGFKGSKLIVFKNGVPSDEEMKTVERKMKAKFAPTDQAGVFIIDFVDDVTRVPEILDLDAGNFADKYNALNDTIQQEIFVGHRITSPMLFGVRVEGQLGGRSEMVDAFNLFQNTYVSPKQAVQEKVYNEFSPVKGLLKIQPIEPIMPSFSEQTLLQILTKDEMREIIGRKPMEVAPSANDLNDKLNTLSPLVANNVIGNLTPNEKRGIVGMPPLDGGETIPTPDPNAKAPAQFTKCKNPTNENDDDLDFSVFQKYGEPCENFALIKHKKFMFSTYDFALDKMEQGVLDLVKKTPNITKEAIGKVLRIDKTKVLDILETLTADGLIDGDLNLTPKGTSTETPSFQDLFIRYKYTLRSDAPNLVSGGESRDFCKQMMENDRYYSREDIDAIGEELGSLYGIANYDAFRRRGGWYHDPNRDVNLPFCRHTWSQELVKKIK